MRCGSCVQVRPVQCSSPLGLICGSTFHGLSPVIIQGPELLNGKKLQIIPPGVVPSSSKSTPYWWSLGSWLGYQVDRQSGRHLDVELLWSLLCDTVASKHSSKVAPELSTGQGRRTPLWRGRDAGQWTGAWWSDSGHPPFHPPERRDVFVSGSLHFTQSPQFPPCCCRWWGFFRVTGCGMPRCV